jgi:hypothetical protein
MSDRFQLEEKIMHAWQVVEDINLLLRQHCDTPMTDDQVQNFLLGLATIYQARFEELQATFEDLLLTPVTPFDEPDFPAGSFKEYVE